MIARRHGFLQIGENNNMTSFLIKINDAIIPHVSELTHHLPCPCPRTVSDELDSTPFRLEEAGYISQLTRVFVYIQSS